MKITLNKKYLLFLFFFYTFIFNEQLSEVINLFQYEDELFALMAIPLFILRRINGVRISGRIGSTVLVLGFVLCGLFGSLIYSYQPFFAAALPDLFLCVKFWLCIFTASELFRSFDLERFARKISFHIRLIAWGFFLLSVVNMLFGIFPFYDMRYNLPSNSLFYNHPVSLLGICGFLVIVLLGIKDHMKNGTFYLVLLGFTMVSTMRTKAVVQLIVIFFVYYFVAIKKQEISARNVMPIIPVALLAGWSQIEYYFLSSTDSSARAQLLLKSFQVANEHFPVGAGFATYGSYYSEVYYSPLYYKYRLNTIYGLSPSYGNFICDSFWPLILGQTGYLGAVFYIGAIVKLIKKLMGLKNTNLFWYVSGIAAVLYLLVDSASGTAFMHPLSMPIAMWIGILLAKIPKKKA